MNLGSPVFIPTYLPVRSGVCIVVGVAVVATCMPASEGADPRTGAGGREERAGPTRERARLQVVSRASAHRVRTLSFSQLCSIALSLTDLRRRRRRRPKQFPSVTHRARAEVHFSASIRSKNEADPIPKPTPWRIEIEGFSPRDEKTS